MTATLSGPPQLAGFSPTIDLVLVRHAESLHNRDGDKVNVDSGLTELGWRQAHAVAGWLAPRYRPDALLASTLVRARQTAEVIATRLNMPVQLTQGLEEADFQYWEELPYRSQHPLDQWNDPWRPNPDISPLYASFRARIRETISDVLARLGSDRPRATIVMVTHGGVIGTLMRGLFGGHHVSVFTANTGVTEFSWQLNHWRLVYHNQTGHLDALNPARTTTSATAQPTSAAPWTNGGNASAILKHYQRVAAATVAGPTPGERELRELVRLAAPSGDERVLDVATGNGALALAFAPNVAHVTAIDLSPAMLERAEAARSVAGVSNLHFRLGEIGVLPLEDAAYDLITWHDLVEYVLDVPALLALFRRLLVGDGHLAFDELVGSDDPVKRATLAAIMSRRDPGINDVLSAGEIENAMKAAGFRILRLERYTVSREISEWLSRAGSEESTRTVVRSMIEAGLDADAAGLGARRNRDGNVIFTESRMRVLAEVQDRPR